MVPRGFVRSFQRLADSANQPIQVHGQHSTVDVVLVTHFIADPHEFQLVKQFDNPTTIHRLDLASRTSFIIVNSVFWMRVNFRGRSGSVKNNVGQC
jgi:hypothetical protein